MTFLRNIFGKKGTEKKTSLIKKCLVCGETNQLEVKFCSSCGSEFPVVFDHFDAFISYRRETGSDLASLLKIQLENNFHKRIFLDVKELQVGRFDEALLRRIEETPNFIVIMSKASLDRCENKSDWLKREIMHAIQAGRNIIPLLIEGFTFPSDEKWALLPPEMKVLASLNGISYSHIHQDAAIRQIASYMKTIEQLLQKRSSSKSGKPGFPESDKGIDKCTNAAETAKPGIEPITSPETTDSKPGQSDFQKSSTTTKPDQKKAGTPVSQELLEIQTIKNTPVKAITIEPELSGKDIGATYRNQSVGKETTVKDELTFNECKWCDEKFVTLELIGTSAKKNALFKKERAKPMNICISESLALLPVNEGIRAFDISNPSTPKFLSFFPAPYMSYKWIEFIRDMGLLRGNDGSFHLIDYKDPANTREIPFDNHFRNVFNNCGNGLLLYHKDILIDLCHAETCGVKVIDFSDEQDINKNVRTFGVIHFPAGCGTLKDDYLVLGSYKEPKMRIVLLSETDVKEFRTLTIETSDGYLQPKGMTASEGRLYIFGHSLSSPRPQLATYDLSKFPEEIELESILELPGEHAVSENYGVQVYISDNWLYYNDVDRLFVYDLSNPEKPKLAFVKEGPFYVTHISGNRMYCGDDRNLWIFKLSKNSSK